MRAEVPNALFVSFFFFCNISLGLLRQQDGVDKFKDGKKAGSNFLGGENDLLVHSPVC